MLPPGVKLRRLTSHDDDRGSFTEIYREQWETGIDALQWNLVRSRAGVLRGVHVHLSHWDYLVMAAGRMRLALCDLRSGSPTFGDSAVVELRSDETDGIAIPPGVAHGFYFPEPATHVYAVSHYWSLDDELGCLWSDPALALDWDIEPLRVSDRDKALPPLSKLMLELAPHQDRLWPPHDAA